MSDNCSRENYRQDQATRDDKKLLLSLKIVCVLVTAIPCVPDSGLGQAEERVTMVTGLALQTVGMRQLSTHTGTLTHLIRGELHGADTLSGHIMSTVLGLV